MSKPGYIPLDAEAQKGSEFCFSCRYRSVLQTQGAPALGSILTVQQKHFKTGLFTKLFQGKMMEKKFLIISTFLWRVPSPRNIPAPQS